LSEFAKLNLTGGDKSRSYAMPFFRSFKGGVYPRPSTEPEAGSQDFDRMNSKINIQSEADEP
jgi:hypothetical protein